MDNSLIKRQDALDSLGEEPSVWNDSAEEIAERNQWRRDVNAIKAVPSAQPKTGHWVEIGDEPFDEWECDVCGFVIDGSGCIDPEEYRDIYIFCPHCGSMMLKEGEEHD